MKKTKIIILITALFSALVTACSHKVDFSFKETTQTLKSTSVRKDASDKTNVLIVYYSATGNTRKIAEMIAASTSGDLFELTPLKPYNNNDLNYNDKSSRIFKEYHNVELRDVALLYNSLNDWDSYDTIFIGYPIWWGNAAWPINSFIQLNDFQNKTIIPFCTSGSSGIAASEDFLKDQAGSGNWKKGKRFSSGTTSASIEKWIKKLELN